MGRKDAPFTFNPDLAEPVEPPPVLFQRMLVPCACGGTLVGEEYQFFPSTVHIRGVCVTCGPRTAIFAPPMPVAIPVLSESQETAAGELHELVRQIRERFRFNSPELVDDVVDYLRSKHIA